jgi:hypothetical protein
MKMDGATGVYRRLSDLKSVYYWFCISYSERVDSEDCGLSQCLPGGRTDHFPMADAQPLN